MVNNPFLNILITTYNRSFFLKQCLSSIEAALSTLSRKEKVEIIVLDNGCTDDTQEVLKHFEQKIPLRLLYEKDNIGFVAGFLKCVSNATGRYCWFLGDDDYIAGRIDDLVDYLNTNDPDILLLDHFFYIYENDSFKYSMQDNVKFLLGQRKNLYVSYEDYIFDIKHPNGFFTHIAPVIFKKDLWDANFSEKAVQKHYCSHSIHIYVFLSILKNSTKIGFFDKKILSLRVGAPNEEWLTEDGRYNRILMDVEFFTDMVKSVFEDQAVIRHFKDVMLKKSVSVLLLGGKIRCNLSASFYLKLLRLLYHHYKIHPFFWYGLVPMIFVPKFAFSAAYKLILKDSRRK